MEQTPSVITSTHTKGDTTRNVTLVVFIQHPSGKANSLRKRNYWQSITVGSDVTDQLKF